MNVDDLPLDRPLTDSEIAVLVAQAIFDDKMSPGANLPFQPSWLELLGRLGIRDPEKQGRFLGPNKVGELYDGFRLAEVCWRMVGLGYLIPKLTQPWGAFYPTERGREFLRASDPALITQGGLDRKLADLGLPHHDLARLYARLSQDCFLAGHYESAVVMLGAATEFLVGQLASVLEAKRMGKLATIAPRPSPVTARRDLRWLAETFDDHKTLIKKEIEKKNLSTDWLSGITDLLNGTGQAIRITRNDAGHPTGVRIDQSGALQLVTLFPRFAEECHAATNTLSAL